MPSQAAQQVRQELGRLADQWRYQANRFVAEMDFAEKLAGLEKRRGWPALIERAWAVVGRAVAAGKLDRLAGAVAEAERLLAPIGKAAKRYTCHLVGHAHIDMNWMWSWPETVATTNDTFTTVLKLMDEFPSFKFSQSQGSVYEIVRRHNPAMFERIRRRVAEGRWEVLASTWVEGDKNLVGGESLARHLLYTRRYFAEQFGLRPADVAVDWAPDTFGHAATIPTIVAGGAVRWYFLGRMGEGYEPRPRAFWWEGPDGSRVLANRGVGWYNGVVGPRYAINMLDYAAETGLRDALCCYGVGDHGGGPTRKDLCRALDMDRWPIFPNFTFSTVADCMRIVERQAARLAALPVLRRELNFIFAGCYTSQSRIKRTNRLAEAYLEQSEALAVLAWRAAGRPYPADELRDRWTDTLFGHFHDILPGSCVSASREYHLGQFQRTAAACSIVKTESLRALAGRVNTAFSPAEPAAPPVAGREHTALGGGVGLDTAVGGVSRVGHVDSGPRPFLVVNPSGWRRDEVVTATVWDIAPESDAPGGHVPARRKSGRSFVVHLPDGRTLPAQEIAAGAWWAHRYHKLAFPLAVGPLGWAACVVAEGPAPAGHAPAVRVAAGLGVEGEGQLVAGRVRMENEFLRVGFDPRSGGVVELADKATGADLARPDQPMAVLEYLLERPRGMSAWVVGDTQRSVCPLELTEFAPGERGPHVASVTARGRIADSTFEIVYSLSAGARRLDIAVKLNWLERGGQDRGTPSLRMRFPFALAEARATYEVPFGHVEREQTGGEEVPALRWADVCGTLVREATNSSSRARRLPSPARKTAGCAVLNDCKHGHSLDGSTLSVRLVRSSYEPDPLPELGEHEMRLAVVPHGGPVPAAELTRLAAAFNSPLEIVAADVHAGELPPADEAIRSVAPAGVVLAAVKKAEDHDAIVLRLIETTGRATVAKVALNADLLGRAAAVEQVDLLERPIANGSARKTPAGLTVKLPARGLASVKVTFAS